MAREGHRVPAGDRGGSDIPSRAQRRAGRRGSAADAGDRRSPRPVARARPVPRSPVGPAGGDVRRGSAARDADGPRLSSAACRATTSRMAWSPPPSTSSATAPRKAGCNWAPAHLNDRELRDVYLRPFEAAVRVAGLGSVMNGYHEIDGVPCGANRWLLDRAPARRVGFRRHRRVRLLRHSPARGLPPRRRVGREAAALALTSGIDVELPGTDCYAGDLRDAFERRCGDDRRRRSRGRSRARVEVPTRTVRPPVRRRRQRRRAHPHNAADRPRRDGSPPTAWCCCATTGCCRCAAPHRWQ